MEFLFWVILLALAWIVYNPWKRLRGRGTKLPPSPPSLPIIGHLHLVFKSRTVLHQALQELSKRYGPIMHLRIGSFTTIVISNATLAREMLKTHDATFAARPRLLVTEFVYKFRDILFVDSSEEHWKRMRKLCSTTLFSATRVETFRWLRTEELSGMLGAILNAHEGGRSVKVRHLMTTFNFNMMTRMLMSKRFLNFEEVELDKEAVEFGDLLGELTTEVLVVHLSEVFPLLRCIDWSIPRLKRLHSRLTTFCKKIIEEHKTYRGTDHVGSKDLMSLLLEDCDEETVQAVTVELMQGGVDTTSTVLEFSVARLLRHPDVMRKAREEIERVVGTSRMVKESDLEKLEYVQAFVKEVLRLHPAAPIAPRYATEDCKLSGYDIPKGATIFVNLYAIARDPAIWENPTEFMPERFLGKSIDVQGQNYAVLPFGGGRKICPGMILGLRVVNLVVANVIHGFEWSYVPGRETRSLDEVTETFSWLKTPVEALATPRLAKEAYTVLA